MKSIFLLVICFAYVTSHVTRYDGHKVFRVTPETADQLEVIVSLSKELSDLDFWAEVAGLGQAADVMVPPGSQETFTKTMESNGIHMEVLIEDVQKKIDEMEPAVSSIQAKNTTVDMTWTNYYNLENINAWLNSLISANPSRVSALKIGQSHEGREIKGIKISFKSGRKGVYIEGGIHAREWISPATTTYLINEILNSKDVAFRKIAESFDWYIVPVSNPDGYAYTHTNSRLWRKNRTPYSLCYGADMNRNWDVFWGTEGTSTSACADTYGGPKAFSEKETTVMSAFLKTIGSNLSVFLSFHSYGQMMLMPYGHTTAHLDNYDDVIKVGKSAVAALAKRYNTVYKVGNTAETIYKHSGGTMDWVKKTFQVPIAFTFELRDTGSNGFVLPASQIIPNCLEIMDSVVAIFQEGEKIGLITLS